VLRLRMRFHARAYAPLALLHASVALRVAGDALASASMTRWGALLSAFALLAFVVNTAAAALRGAASR
jgi:hypothetical protein